MQCLENIVNILSDKRYYELTGIVMHNPIVGGELSAAERDFDMIIDKLAIILKHSPEGLQLIEKLDEAATHRECISQELWYGFGFKDGLLAK